MSAADLEVMAASTDFGPSCPVKVVEREGLSPFGGLTPIPPVPADEDVLADRPEPRRWQYRTC